MRRGKRWFDAILVEAGSDLGAIRTMEYADHSDEIMEAPQEVLESTRQAIALSTTVSKTLADALTGSMGVA